MTCTGLLAASAPSQLVSVDCCLGEHELAGIGPCVSGPHVDPDSEVGPDAPAGCLPPAVCVAGFGPGSDSAALMERICSVNAVPQPVTRGFCSSWREEDALVVAESCVVSPAIGLELFGQYDVDLDGDLDLEDVAAFQNIYRMAPRRNQTEARPVFVECCYSETALRSVGECLSGPHVPHSLSGCADIGSCLVGWSEPIEPGDYAHSVCRSEPPAEHDPMRSFCTTWTEPDAPPVAQYCPATHTSGITSFVVFDTDGDGDLDLADYAEYQTEFALPDSE